MTKRLWQVHSWLGLAAGLGLLVIGVTGSLLVFAQELETIFNPQFMRVASNGAQRLPMDDLLHAANRALPEYEVTGWLIRHDEPALADVVYVIAHGTDEWRVATLDPYTGTLLASPRKNSATLTGWLLDLHYTFFADHAGMMITGALAVMLCVLALTGFWLYRDFWRSFFRLRWRASARIYFSSFHKTVGITSVAFNFLLGFTGAYWNVTHVIGEWIDGEHEQPKMTHRLYDDSVSLDGLISEASRQLPGFRANFVSLPSEPGAGFTLWGKVASANSLRGTYGSTVTFDAQTGDALASRNVNEAGWWAQFVDMFEPLHYGNFGGWPVKIIWCVGGLTPGRLALSGAIIWWKRRKRSPASDQCCDS